MCPALLLQFPDDLAGLGAWAGIIGCLFSFIVFVRQEFQNREIARLQNDNSRILESLVGQEHRVAMIRRLFGHQDTHNPRHFTCLVPATWEDGRTLPHIMCGDYYALHVIQQLLGKHLELRPVSPEGAPDDELQHHNQDTIYLCTPQVNPELNRIAPPVSAANPVPHFGGKPLPCWFAASDGGRKQIWVGPTEVPIVSEAEHDYERAEQRQPGTPYVPENEIQRDAALIARLTSGGRKHFVVAGIHQYGTWVAGEFLHKLTTSKHFAREQLIGDVPYEEDFVAVIVGAFHQSKTLTVEDCNIDARHFWVFRENQWVRRNRPTNESRGSLRS